MLNFLFGKSGGNEDTDDEESLTQYNDTQMMDADVDELIHGRASSEVPEETAMATEDSEQQEQSIEEEVPAEPQPVTPSAQATLVDLLVKAFPDSMIQAPKIVIVGSQSSGKTKLIISMIFLSLIQHPHFTDEMGDILLKVFRTGSGLTTRRPIKVSLLHSSDRESCSIQFRHGNETYDFGNPLLPAFIDRLHDFSGNEIFESPLEITIRAYQLPNIQFTDMPGLRSTDVPLADSPSKTLQTMVEECIANKANTVVAVESALQVSSGGDDTSLLYPIMDATARVDPELHQRSILVLTKCDKITPEAFKADVLPYFRHAAINRLYKCVIGSVNKIDGQPEPHTISFSEFRAIFEQTRQQEREVFQQRGNLSPVQQCTTHALYVRINDIFRSLLLQALLSGHENLQSMREALSYTMRQQLAPPIYLYRDDGDERATSQSTATAAAVATTGGPGSSSSGVGHRLLKKHLLEEIQKAALECAKRSVVTVPLPCDVSANGGGGGGGGADDDFVGSPAMYLQMEIGLEWPAVFVPGNLEDALQRRRFFEHVVVRMELFVELILMRIDAVFTDVHHGVFAEPHSPFHHLHRFHNLQSFLKEELVGLCDRHKQRFLQLLHSYLEWIWMFEEPAGNLSLPRLVEVLRQARHLILVDCISFVQHYLYDELTIDWTRPGILEEAVTYVDRRQQLNLQYERVLIQLEALERCLLIQENVDLEHALETVIQETRSRLESLTAPSLTWEAEFWYSWYVEYKEQLRLASVASASVPSSQTTTATAAAAAPAAAPAAAAAARTASGSASLSFQRSATATFTTAARSLPQHQSATAAGAFYTSEPNIFATTTSLTSTTTTATAMAMAASMPTAKTAASTSATATAATTATAAAPAATANAAPEDMDTDMDQGSQSPVFGHDGGHDSSTLQQQQQRSSAYSSSSSSPLSPPSSSRPQQQQHQPSYATTTATSGSSNKRRLDGDSDTDDHWEQTNKRMRSETAASSFLQYQQLQRQQPPQQQSPFQQSSPSRPQPSTSGASTGLFGVISHLFGASPSKPSAAAASSSSSSSSAAPLAAPFSAPRRPPPQPQRSTFAADDEDDDDDDDEAQRPRPTRLPSALMSTPGGSSSSGSRSGSSSHGASAKKDSTTTTTTTTTVKDEPMSQHQQQQQQTPRGGSVFSQLSQRYGSRTSTPNTRDDPIVIDEDDA